MGWCVGVVVVVGIGREIVGCIDPRTLLQLSYLVEDQAADEGTRGHLTVDVWSRSVSALSSIFALIHHTTHHEKPSGFCGEQGQRLLDDVWCGQRKPARRWRRASAAALSSWRSRSCCDTCVWQDESRA